MPTGLLLLLKEALCRSLSVTNIANLPKVFKRWFNSIAVCRGVRDVLTSMSQLVDSLRFERSCMRPK